MSQCVLESHHVSRLKLIPCADWPEGQKCQEQLLPIVLLRWTAFAEWNRDMFVYLQSSVEISGQRKSLACKSVFPRVQNAKLSYYCSLQQNCPLNHGTAPAAYHGVFASIAFNCKMKNYYCNHGTYKGLLRLHDITWCLFIMHFKLQYSGAWL